MTDILPFKATTRTLPNGLVVIVVPTGFPNIVSLQIPVLTGSRNEIEPGKSGFAHFFEHMMFRGTPTLSPDAYNAIITKAGARQNAYTTDDYTNYHVTFAKEDLETILKIEADRFQNLSYPVEAFKTEARAVLGEYNKNSANPLRKLYEVMRATLLHDAPLPSHHDGLHRRHRGHAEPVRVLQDVLFALVPAAERGGDRRWRRGGGQGHAARREVLGPMVPRPARKRSLFRRSQRARGPVYAHVPWETPTASMGSHLIPRSRLQRDRKRRRGHRPLHATQFRQHVRDLPQARRAGTVGRRVLWRPDPTTSTRS